MSGLLHKSEDLLSDRPSVRVSVHMLLEADRVNQLESGMKNFVALVQDISSTRMKPFLEAQPFGRIVWCTKSILTVLVMMVNPNDILCYRVVG